MTEERKEYLRNYYREYRAKHPDREHEYRVAQYARYLEKYGYKVEQAEVKK